MAYTVPMQMSKVYDDRHIITQVTAKNKDELFRVLAHHIATLEDLDENQIYEGLRAREAMMNTVIAPGIALPHTQLKNFGRSTGIFAVIPEGCDYAAGQPIKIAAMIVDDDSFSGEHLDTLRNFAVLARNPRFMEKIMEAKTAEEIYSILKRFETQG